ncbi:NHL domain-containing protein [Streptomyces abikoensis]|uniref:NHL domain-containing protein n=1 Tax=Streptomyces abikoensis TaxID=97398 RepID=UPI00167A8157|nr:hypothetical protein [Streptomyces abikoensis]GGP35123.1 hypothetical protein GCM10010214_04610 [Streptomyces abikoensis]
MSEFGTIQKTSVRAGDPAISTTAGNGIADYTGDGSGAAKACLYHPNAVATDASGNLYIADTDNHVVRKVDARTRVITTVAGNNDGDYAGDGRPAVAASLRYPRGVATDASGNLYIADTGNNRVRRVDATTRIITTVAGDGGVGFRGDGGAATTATLYTPFGVAVDSLGNLYIADTDNHRIRRVDATDRTITTLAGNGNAGCTGDDRPAVEATLQYPRAVTVDAIGNVYIADTDNHVVRKVDAMTRTISTVAGDGNAGRTGDDEPAVKASLRSPRGVAVDPAGNLYIADTGNNRVRRVDERTRLITTVAGDGEAGFSGDDGPAVKANLYGPRGIAVDSAGNLYIADTDNHRVREVSGASPLARFSVLPVGPPDPEVTLTHAGETGYPGVRLYADTDGTVPRQKVVVTLPAGKELGFVAQGDPGHLLTVANARTGTTVHRGTLSPDGRTLVFEDVDLGLTGKGSESRAWVAVRASRGTPLGDTALRFAVGDVPSDSTRVHVVVDFAVSPSGSEPKLTRAGDTGFAGVEVIAREEGTLVPQNVRVALPTGAGLRFVPEHEGFCQLTVMDTDGHTTPYDGILSADGQTLTVEAVTLPLSGKGSKAGLWGAVKASADAPVGTSRLDVQVGNRASLSGRIHVVAA